MKRNELRLSSLSLKVIALSSIAILAITSAFACSKNPSAQVYDPSSIIALESKISALQSDRYYSESKYLEKIDALSSKLDSLEATKAPAESSSAPEEPSESQYFGFGYTVKNGEVTITSYSGSSLELIIPATIGGLPVVAIGDGAFENSSLISASIPETVKSIGWFAFNGSKSLTRIIIPKNVTDIGYNAFSGASNLTVYAAADSYAYQYAKSYGLKVSAE